MTYNIAVTGVALAATKLGAVGDAARYFMANPVTIGPTVFYGVYQEPRFHYMQMAAEGVAPAVPQVIEQALMGGPSMMATGLEKLARDVQGRAVARAPRLTGALQASIGVFHGAVGLPTSRGGAPSGRMRNAPVSRARR